MVAIELSGAESKQSYGGEERSGATVERSRVMVSVERVTEQWSSRVGSRIIVDVVLEFAS